MVDWISLWLIGTDEVRVTAQEKERERGFESTDRDRETIVYDRVILY